MIQDEAQDVIPEDTQDVIQDEAQDVIPEDAQDLTQEDTQDLTQEEAQDSTQEEAQNSTQENLSDVNQTMNQDNTINNDNVISSVEIINNTDNETSFPISLPIVAGAVAVAGLGVAGVAATTGLGGASSSVLGSLFGNGGASAGASTGTSAESGNNSNANSKKIENVKIKRRNVFSENTLNKNSKKFKYTVPQFNLKNFDSVTNTLIEANNIKSPVVISSANLLDGSENQLEVFIDKIQDIIKENAIKVPVCINLDCGNFEQCTKAISLGYTSVVYQPTANANVETIISEINSLSKLANKKQSIVEIRFNILDRNGNIADISPQMCGNLVNAGVKSISLNGNSFKRKDVNNWEDITINSLKEFNNITNKLKFSVFNNTQFTQDQVNELVKLNVSKINIEPDDSALGNPDLFNQKLQKFHSVGKSTNYLKFANQVYKLAKSLLEFI